VLSNLLSNAIKFTEHRLVRLTVEREGEQVTFAIEDRGIGVSE